MPKRIQMTRNKPWRKDNPDAVIVDRRSRWGNPFRIGDDGVPDAEAAVRMFTERLTPYTHRGPAVHGSKLADLCIGLAILDDIERELRGKDLACWCPLDQPCHADVLLVLANDDEAE